MPKAQAIQINWQFTGSAGIMQVEHTADCFGGAWLLIDQVKQKHDIANSEMIVSMNYKFVVHWIVNKSMT